MSEHTNRQNFDLRLKESFSSKSSNSSIPTLEKRNTIISRLDKIGKNCPKVHDDYYLLKHFEILRVGNEDRLIKKRKSDESDFKFIIAQEEIYDAVKTAHLHVGHGGEKKTFAEVKNKWANLTLECCKAFINFCADCQEKKKRKVHKGLVVKPVRSETIFARAQIDLINFQTLPDDQYKYIMTYVNHLTKFCVLTPLTSKRAIEVAHALLPIIVACNSKCHPGSSCSNIN